MVLERKAQNWGVALTAEDRSSITRPLPMTIPVRQPVLHSLLQWKVSHYRDGCISPGNRCSEDYECCRDSCHNGVCGKLQHAAWMANQACSLRA